MQEQTWWNKNIETQLETFKCWVGEANAHSKIYMANYLKDKNYKNLLDAGCANATFKKTLDNNSINIDYTGADSCKYFIETNKLQGLNMIDSDIRKIAIPDNSFDIVFSRHTLEHQPDFETILNEFIRLAQKEVSHIFFLKPTDSEKIHYNPSNDLYHNIYSKSKIESFLKDHLKVSNWLWVDINNDESVLHIYLK